MWWCLFDLQDGRCACCPAPAQSIDHDHRTGAVRGLLCISCNRREPECADAEQRCAYRHFRCLRAYRQAPPAAGLGWIRLGPEKFRHRADSERPNPSLGSGFLF
ncbi:Recombination endonuclease VII [Streptomyces zhaozhouensis]|uniref:Recombination endonuclease VII n=1 Tax=Streptomyces zhaozhouensis TaxID=1300267 RepID=A0A286E925_9ACTN|nr:endonuclease domain-containing protein [Streptomyces zhaozhouensis]SOD67407.1 Recombination endonuclease VII [Streptomyces zhaozhouensis]